MFITWPVSGRLFRLFRKIFSSPGADDVSIFVVLCVQISNRTFVNASRGFATAAGKIFLSFSGSRFDLLLLG